MVSLVFFELSAPITNKEAPKGSNGAVNITEIILYDELRSFQNTMLWKTLDKFETLLEKVIGYRNVTENEDVIV